MIFHAEENMVYCAEDDDMPFLGPEWPICPEQFFFKYKPLLLVSITYWPFSLKNFKDSSCESRVMRLHNFWAKNGPFPQMRIFSENLLMSLVSFIHAYLHAKNQSQI